MKRIELKTIFNSPDLYYSKDVFVCGWIRTIRTSKSLGFIELNDGTSFNSIQVVFEESKITNFKEISKLNVGSSININGMLVSTPEAKQAFEIHANSIEIEGESSSDYPLQKKRHSMEFLREIAHLRPRTNTFSATFRVRSVAAYAIHTFFNERNFIYAHTPLITANDGEGAGEMFRVTTLDPKNPPLTKENEVDFKQDFFGKLSGLTVTGQLEAEAMAMAFSNVYTFGPTFRAENSNTKRHAAEFWMIEPEIAFANLNDVICLAEDMVKFIIKTVLEKCPDEMQFFNKFYDNNLIERLSSVVESDFARISYTDAIKKLEENNHNFKDSEQAFWGCDLATVHERYLTEEVFGKPVFVTDYPKEIKAFYMRLNDDNKTVAATDLLVPGIGELIGGSQREERMDVLLEIMKDKNLEIENYDWYLDLRKYGGTKHAGYGLGFERMLMYLTAIPNIRDVIPFPRTPGSINF